MKIFNLDLKKDMLKPTKIKLIFALTVLLLLAIAATAIYNGIERFDITKFNKTKYTVQGGGTADGSANLSRLTYTHQGEGQTDIVFTFSSGSGEQMQDESGKAYLPEYTVEFLQSPLRLKVTLHKLAYWDYIISGAPVDETSLVSGGFRHSNNEDTVVYFNLSADVLFKLTESENTLTVSLKKADEQDAGSSWYLLCDLYYEFQAGEMPESDFTPTLCSDKISVIMISTPFESEAQANEEKERLLTGAFEGQSIRTAELDRFTLPKYSDKTDTLALLNESILSINGAKTTLPLFFADARFLCWLPDNSGALFAKSEDSGEILYVADKSGTKHQLLSQSFATVIKASYSANSARLAFIEQAEASQLITVADISTGEVSVIGGDMGASIFGNTVISVALNGDGTKLYCLSGDGIYSLKEYDFSTREISLIATSIVTESEIYYSNGYLYYCDVVDEYECVMRIATLDGSKQVITRGSQFVLAPNGEFVVVLTEDYETAVTDLRAVAIQSQESTATDAPSEDADGEASKATPVESSKTVVKDIITGEFFISSDSKDIYYIIETGDEEFYYQIMKYNIATEETTVMAQAVNGVFFPSNVADEIIISVIYSGDDGTTHPVTYIANFVPKEEE